MGVNGLWQIVHPCARPTNLATLNRKRLAVDASIWIYQFLKAVRDKEGNALRNSHVVGFFRRICKLLWFGIRPVFVFDGGAPALKRQTIQGRKRRREGRREDAVRTAGKLLAVQMQRMAEEEEEKRKRSDRGEDGEEAQEELPSADKIVYMDEVGMSAQERQRSRKFYKQDAYHLPDLDGGITAMGGGNDPRIMSIEELEEYARQFHNGEDVNLYDFSNIDFDGDFFRSLPPVDRYNILNAARLRSRLRMGLSKEQLDDMYPDRMAFSRFQVQRVKERNNLTQRVMREAGMSGLDLTLTANGGRIAGDKDREYILVKNEGVEGGWALGVVGKEKDVGEVNNPIDVDALQFRYQKKDDEEDWEDDAEFEDVPVEGLNRLPKFSDRRLDEEGGMMEDEDSLFVGAGSSNTVDELFEPPAGERLHPEEEADISRAIALSLQSQHGVRFDVDEDDEEVEFEDVDMPEPEWEQKTAEAPRPITATSGIMVAHIVNNRANAAVRRRRGSDASSDSDDLHAALAASRKLKKALPAPTHANVKNPFDGPLPFPKLDWNSLKQKPTASPSKPKAAEDQALEPESDEEELAGGFEREPGEDAPRPLPPWMVDTTDIRESIKKQQEAQSRMNARDREMAVEEEMLFQRKHQDELIEIGSSSDDDSDIEVVEIPPPKEKTLDSPKASPEVTITQPVSELEQGVAAEVGSPEVTQANLSEQGTSKAPMSSQPSRGSEFKEVPVMNGGSSMSVSASDGPQGESQSQESALAGVLSATVAVTEDIDSPEPTFEDVQPSGLLSVEQLENPALPVDTGDDDLFTKDDEDEFSDDAEEEELLAQMAEEAEEHARFASELNNKSTQENREAYERELRRLRTQQKKDRRDADEVTQVMITECQALLRLFGIPYITAPMEAEAQCAELVGLGLVDGIVTDDSDIFLFGGTRVYKNMFNSAKFVECYLTADLEKDLSLSREELIAVAQLLGSDYTEGLPGVGPVTAVEILSEFPGSDGLEQFRDWWKDVQVHNRPKEVDARSPFRKKFRKAQATKLFLPPGFPSPAVADAYLKPEVDKSMEPFQWGVPDLAGLREFLMTTIGWSQERTDEVLLPVIKDINRRDMEGTQANITRYFEGGVGVGAKEAFAPRQRGKGSRRMAEAVNKLRASTASDGAAIPADDGGVTTAKRKRRNGPSVTEREDRSADEADETVPRDDNRGRPGNKGKKARTAG